MSSKNDGMIAHIALMASFFPELSVVELSVFYKTDHFIQGKEGQNFAEFFRRRYKREYNALEIEERRALARRFADEVSLVT